ncbi:MAG: DHHA1 domain-containing protein, partial [Planctomycetota bacterium]
MGKVSDGELSAGQSVSCRVSDARLATMRNHSATHLLNWALREVLGEHVNQAGSVVAPDRLRFDLTHTQAVTAEQQAEVERIVNRWIVADEPVAASEMALADAHKIQGLRAMFGEKYGDVVRVITVGGGQADGREYPVELCGGTHVERTGQIGLFKIVSEESVAKGVRRITALTGPAAVEHIQQLEATASAAAKALRIAVDELPQRVGALLKEVKALRKSGGKAPAVAEPGSAAEAQNSLGGEIGPAAIERIQQLDAAVSSAAKALKVKTDELPQRVEALLKERKDLRSGGGKATAGGGELETIAELDSQAGKVLVVRTGQPDAGAMRTICDTQRQKGAAAVFVGGADGEKVMLVAMVSDDLVKAGALKAGDWVKAIAPVVGGGGGGKPTLAQAGGKQPAKL